MTPTTRAARAHTTAMNRRGVVFIAAVVGSFWHFNNHDLWWWSPDGAALHTLLSATLVAAATWAGRPLPGARGWTRWAPLSLGALVFVHQPLVLLGSYGALRAKTDWDAGWAGTIRPWDRSPCEVDRDTRLRRCPPWDPVPSCLGGPDYRTLLYATQDVVMRTAVHVFGPAPGSYLGTYPTEDEAFRTPTEPAEMTAGVVRTAFASPRLPLEWTWQGTRSLGLARLDGGGLLWSWDGGAVVDLYDVTTARRVASWTRSGHAPLTHLSAPFLRGDTALWLRRRWLHSPTTDVEILALRFRAAAHRIGVLYPFVGPMKPGGRFGWRDGDTLVEYDPDVARRFFTRVHGTRPLDGGLGWKGRPTTRRLTVLPWTGGVLGRDAFPDDPAWRARFVAEARALVDLGADGVHVNIEPMPEGTPGYLDLLRELKTALAPALVSVAAYPPPTPLHPFPDVHWSPGFLGEVCAIADDVSVMGYDTALDTPAAYTALISEWTKTLIQSFEGRTCRWRMGIPTYDEDKSWHRPDAETLSAALDGVIPVLDREPGLVGLAIYSSWTTDAAEWREFDVRWGFGPENSDAIDPP